MWPRGPGGRPGGWVVEVVEVCRTVGDVAQAVSPGTRWPVRWVVEVVVVYRTVCDVALDVAPRGRRTMRFFCIEIRLLAHSHGEVRQCVVQMQASVRLLTLKTLVRAACSASWRSRYLPQATTVFGTCSSGPRVASRKNTPLCQLLIHAQKALCRLSQPHGVQRAVSQLVVNARQRASGLGAFTSNGRGAAVSPGECVSCCAELLRREIN